MLQILYYIYLIFTKYLFFFLPTVKHYAINYKGLNEVTADFEAQQVGSHVAHKIYELNHPSRNKIKRNVASQSHDMDNTNSDNPDDPHINNNSGEQNNDSGEQNKDSGQQNNNNSGECGSNSANEASSSAANEANNTVEHHSSVHDVALSDNVANDDEQRESADDSHTSNSDESSGGDDIN